MNQAELLKNIFDERKIRVMQQFIQDPLTKYTLSEVVGNTQLPLATTHRILKELRQKNVITYTKQKHLTLYQLADNEGTKTLSTILYEEPNTITEFVNYIRYNKGIQQIIMHGKAQKNRANVVIIGTQIDKEIINQKVAEMREEKQFTISHLILEPEQFSMLENMGQFSGQKNILYEKKT